MFTREGRYGDNLISECDRQHVPVNNLKKIPACFCWKGQIESRNRDLFVFLCSACFSMIMHSRVGRENQYTWFFFVPATSKATNYSAWRIRRRRQSVEEMTVLQIRNIAWIDHFLVVVCAANRWAKVINQTVWSRASQIIPQLISSTNC